MPNTNNNKRKRDYTEDTKNNNKDNENMAPADEPVVEEKKQGNDLEGRDFYEVLGVTKDATPKEISLAYRKLATKIHPDKNRDDPFAKDKFQTLGKIHMTLSDPEKRKIYDQTGESSDDAVSTGDVDWNAYFNLVFKKVTKKDIRNFEKKYRGSEEEKKDVKEAYIKCKGNIKKVIELIMLSRDEDLGRFSTYCKEAIDSGELKMMAGFKNFEKHVGKNLEIVFDESEEEKEIPKELALNFANRKSAFDDLTKRLEEKYGGKKTKGKGKKKIEEEEEEEELEEIEEEEEEEGNARKKKKVAGRGKKGAVKRSLTRKTKKRVVKDEAAEDDE